MFAFSRTWVEDDLFLMLSLPVYTLRTGKEKKGLPPDFLWSKGSRNELGPEVTLLAGLLARLCCLELSLERCLMHRFLVQQQLRRLQVRIGVEPILHNVVIEQVEHGQ